MSVVAPWGWGSGLFGAYFLYYFDKGLGGVLFYIEPNNVAWAAPCVGVLWNFI